MLAALGLAHQQPFTTSLLSFLQSACRLDERIRSMKDNLINLSSTDNYQHKKY